MRGIFRMPLPGSCQPAGAAGDVALACRFCSLRWPHEDTRFEVIETAAQNAMSGKFVRFRTAITQGITKQT